MPKSNDGKDALESQEAASSSESPTASRFVSAIVNDKPVCSCGVRGTGDPKAGEESGES